MDIKKCVNKLIKKHNTRNPFNIASDMNIIVIFHKLHGVKGFYQYYKRNNIIYIDENLSCEEKKLVCAHELGHMMLHKGMNRIFLEKGTGFNIDKYEIEANKFAMELLVSDDSIDKSMTLSQLSRMLGYSESMLALKLKDFI